LDAEEDELDVQRLSCSDCASTFAASHQRSHRGAEVRERHDAVRTTERLDAALATWLAVCADPQQRSCGCASHRALRQGGRVRVPGLVAGVSHRLVWSREPPAQVATLAAAAAVIRRAPARAAPHARIATLLRGAVPAVVLDLFTAGRDHQVPPIVLGPMLIDERTLEWTFSTPEHAKDPDDNTDVWIRHGVYRNDLVVVGRERRAAHPDNRFILGRDRADTRLRRIDFRELSESSVSDDWWVAARAPAPAPR
jgi:hypothetical protein